MSILTHFRWLLNRQPLIRILFFLKIGYIRLGSAHLDKDRNYFRADSLLKLATNNYMTKFSSLMRKILVSKHLKEFQEILNDRNFFRPHNSHLINLDFVKKYIRYDGGYIEMTDGSKIPIAR